MLNFFKPISGGRAKQPTQKRHVLPAASLGQKKPKLSPQSTIDLVNGSESTQHGTDGQQAAQDRSLNRLSTSTSPAVPSNNSSASMTESVSIDSRHRGNTPEVVQEGHLHRTDSNESNPAVSHVRRFKGVPYAPDAGSISFLTNMGFNQDQAVRALKVTQGNIERAANWLLSGM